MPKIKHIAIATQDIDKTAGFYKDVFGLREIAKLESANANGYFLSDGNVNMAIWIFKMTQLPESAVRNTAVSTTSDLRSKTSKMLRRNLPPKTPLLWTRSTRP